MAEVLRGRPQRTYCMPLGIQKKMIADVGGWMLREDAADLYLRANEITRRKILSSLMEDLVKCGQMQRHIAVQAMEKRKKYRPQAAKDRRSSGVQPEPEQWFTMAHWRKVQ